MLKRLLWLLILVFLITSMAGLFSLPARAQVTDPTDFVYLPTLFKNYEAVWDFRAPETVTLIPTPSSDPFLVIDSSGRPHLFWDSIYSGSKFIYHSYRTPQGWTAPAPVAQSLGVSKLLNPPVVGDHNDIYIVWRNDLNMGGPYRILYAAFDGQRWGPEYELLGQSKSPYVNGLVRLNAQGLPTVSYIESDYFSTANVYYQRWMGTAFTARQEIMRPDYSSLIWLDSDSGVRFYGDQYTTSQVHYSYWRDGSFRVSDKTSAGKINSRSSLLDRAGNLHLMRVASVPVPGGNVYGVYQQCLTNSIAFLPEAVLSGQTPVQTARYGFNENLDSILAWSSNNQTTITSTFWNGCKMVKKIELALPALPKASYGNFLAAAQNTKAQGVCFLSEVKYSSTMFLLTCNR